MSPDHMVLEGTYLMRLTKPDSCDELLSSEFMERGVKGLLDLVLRGSMSSMGESTGLVSFFRGH
jgi:hypothetical protein